MSLVTRFAYDGTGVNPDNLVLNEPHSLSNKPVRGVATVYGPFYSESLRIIDGVTNRLLQKGADYQVTELLQDIALRTGKEVCCVILITNPAVSAVVNVTYQTVGGLYQNEVSTGIISLYETIANDNRDIDWINVLNKPLEYNPTDHLHVLTDVVGFEPIVLALERIRNAMMMSDVPIYEALISWINGKLSALVGDINNANANAAASMAAIIQEVIDRKAADTAEVAARNTAISTSIAAEVTNRTNADNAEATARIAGDAALAGQMGGYLPLTGGIVTGQLKHVVPMGSGQPVLQQEGGSGTGGITYYDTNTPDSGIYNYKFMLDLAAFTFYSNTVNSNAGNDHVIPQDVLLASLSATTGQFTATGDVTAFSDPRLKSNITPIKNALELVNELEGVFFVWNENSYLTKMKHGQRDIGVLATDIRRVLPEALGWSMFDAQTSIEYDTVAYDKLAPLLIEAVKELSQQVTQQKTEIEALKELTANLSAVVESLKKA